MVDYREMARQSALDEGIDADKFVAQINQESGFNPDVINCTVNSSAGAQGIAQIVPKWHPSVNPCDPEAALIYAAALMKGYLDNNNNNWIIALSCYNAGAGATMAGMRGEVDGWPYKETIYYVSAILGMSYDAASYALSPHAANLTYNLQQPPERQIQDWVCSIRAATWSLKSLGVLVDASSMQDDMVDHAEVTRTDGLLDGRGFGLSNALQRHLPLLTPIKVELDVAWDRVLQLAGNVPICMGSALLYHWLNVAYNNADGTLHTPNPAPTYHGIYDDMTHAEFDTWAPWNIVYVDIRKELPVPLPSEIDVDHLRTLVGCVYNNDGNIMVALNNLLTVSSLDDTRVEIKSIISWLKTNRPG